MAFFTQDYLDFFIELAANNNKDWFDLNRKRYEQSVKIPFQQFTKHLINSISKDEPAFKELEPKDCMFRINRDIRFSKDKTPYKLMCSAVIAPGGKKSRAINGIYFELGPEHVRAYGGIYEIDKEDLEAVREGIAANLETFKKLYTETNFKNLFGELRGEKNKIVPAYLRDAAVQEELIFNKQFYFFAEFPAETVVKADLDKILLNCYHVGRPMENFLNQFIQQP
ncbi:MAG: DUF2461 domain-containing protein [Flavobacteriales bacterium]|nr:DUF2461 domain-containing protein [Flavobacteriales bacterium]